ncbi:MAG: SDR family NAD(P)-dependent oxidoreductase [Hyphomicrobiales bacterium]|nr:SDR family NAD(P)-dependent oxidoreductase [Hyphomicrobiales bacterium]
MKIGDARAERIVWITGASSGIGKAVALRLADEGWTVAVSARSDDALGELEAARRGRITAFPLDVTDAKKAADTLHAIEDRLGPVDLALLAAGTFTRDSAFAFDASDARRMVEVNLVGTMNTLAPLLERMMERRRGHIAVTASVAGFAGLPGGATYGATKAALNLLCEAMMPEAERRNVLLTIVNPGFVDTPLTRRNDFPMPFLISAEEATDHIVKGLTARRREIVFPWQMALSMKFLRLLPRPLLLALTRRMVREPAAGAD